MKTIKDFFNKLLEINNRIDFQSNKADDVSDLMLDLQEYLIETKVINSDLFPSNINSIDDELISNIFLDVRRNFQDDDEEIRDFSYLQVADKWLSVNNVKINF